ncbi:MAG: HepT-like ribonuclease domain-containing protein [Acidobacteriaceae bacterium]
MHSKNPAVRLRETLDNIAAIASFTAGFDREGFGADRKTVYAVVRALDIISEASRRLPDEVKERHPEIDWAAIAAAGNIYRHEYEGIDESLIWKTVQDDLETLRSAGEAELKRPPEAV